MAGIYRKRALNLNESARRIFHSSPPWVQSSFRRSRHIINLTTALLRPAKVVHTLSYHSHLYRIRKVEFAGLHLGSSNQKIRGFLNVDANAFVNCDVISGLEKLKLSDGSAGIIYASHVFEHFPKSKISAVLTEWFRVLKPGGKLFLCVPDLEMLASIYLKSLPAYECEEARHMADLACDVIYGGQINKYDFHYYGYSYTTIKSLLQSIGFDHVERFDRKALSFAPFQDAGLATINNIPISLNIEAVK